MGIYAGIVLFLGIAVWLIRRLNRQPKLSKNQFYQAREHINKTATLDPNHALINSHKAFVAALQSLYPHEKQKATGAALIKRVAVRIPNEKVIWKLHRARNQAAHETSFTVYEKTASQARHEFVRALKSLG